MRLQNDLALYHSACQSGDLEKVKYYVEKKKHVIESDGIGNSGASGLHWASTCNRLAVVKYLVKNGVDVNLGSDNTDVGTALQWATRYGYIYVMFFLIQNGANTNSCDKDGNTLLHEAVKSGNVMAVLYVLFTLVDLHRLELNAKNKYGETALSLAAYQGDEWSVYSILRFGADITQQDLQGYTSLHNGVLSGNRRVVKYLLTYGADLTKTTKDMKTVSDIAKESRNLDIFIKPCKSCAWITKGKPLGYRFNRFWRNAITFSIPFALCGFLILNSGLIPTFFAVLPVIFLTPLLIKVVKLFVLQSYTPPETDHSSILETPMMVGVFLVNMGTFIVLWLVHLQEVFFNNEYYLNFVFPVLSTLLLLCYGRLIFSDPGCIPEETDTDLIRNDIEKLIKLGSFNCHTFCLKTWIRKPVRCSLSKLNQQQVARFDHYCAWIYNDVGLKNHKLYIFFLILLETFLMTFGVLNWRYFGLMEKTAECFLFNRTIICHGYKNLKVVFLFLVWTIFQAIFVGNLLMLQLRKIAYGITTFELVFLKEFVRNRSLETKICNDYFDVREAAKCDESASADISTCPKKYLITPRIHCTDPEATNRLLVVAEFLGFDEWRFPGEKEIQKRKETIGYIPSWYTATSYGKCTNIKDFWLSSQTNAPTLLRIFQLPNNSKALLNGEVVDYFRLYNMPQAS
ncbi:ankyrin repeat domain-containing DHHC palmitoyltransferase family protein KNAG_0B03140 [Huiozyma naganishii CBS 8797]|uniref:Palmitoyltransferase n=1 Tax=Huiozyma naganishii (strain ATCC MYA-139 / BCRC 22969 / CBS 8797 / KCTC 17520 / NBRC 10181 / NCYC 3082 / Yp74L-3) TaxID=1071383 RepID=J7R1R2_HUIN7|nr:hypothetical protein KNAG_0B03140 [Kazachstania naganishii CBS 8797]CCK68755.1 hypothetical protein KNAG_0B03140 [Kazachstania naganishii CBS 8797]